MNEQVVLDVQDLHTYFRTASGTVKAVDGVSFAVPAASTLGIVGESGSGKSVCALSIMRLIESPGYIARGRVMFHGQDLARLDEPALRQLRGRDIAMVFQEPMTALNPVYTCGEQVAEALRAHQRVSRREAMKRAVELLRQVGIPDPHRRARAYPHNLSGGMRQRVMIAMALANAPDLLILDEPTTALDVTVQAQILELVRGLGSERNTAVLLITHDIGVIAEMADRVIVMYGGKIMEQGTCSQVISDPKHPYTQGLLASLPSLASRRHRLNVIPGSVPDPLHLPPGCPFMPRCPHAMDVCAHSPDLLRLDDGRDVFCWLYEPPGRAADVHRSETD